MNEIIMNCLDANESIDDESVAYSKPGEYPFTREELREFNYQILDDAGGWDVAENYSIKGAMFESYAIPFENEGKKYILHIMFGQGSAWTLFTESAHQKYRDHVANLDLKLE